MLTTTGFFETFVVFNTIHGAAYPAARSYWPVYVCTGKDRRCGGSPPYEPGRFVLWFVDALAPGFIASSPTTWTLKSVGLDRRDQSVSSGWRRMPGAAFSYVGQ